MEVAPHTSIKHRTLGVYFKIVRMVMKQGRPLYYVDLYAGDGECVCDEAPLKRWDPPLIQSLLKPARKDNLQLHSFLNDLDIEHFNKLKDSVRGYEDYIVDITNENANSVYPKFLSKIPKDQWSIFFIDPYKHSELSWKTIEGIAQHTGYDTYSRCTRKPELIINLMTTTMQRTFDKSPEAITEVLGTDEWKERIEGRSDEKMHEIFLDIFTKQLESLGYSVTSFMINQTPPLKSTLYYLVFASNIPKANEIISKKFEPYIKQISKDKWIKENFRFRMYTKARKAGNASLEDYI